MSITSVVFPFECKGRNVARQEVLTDPIQVKLIICGFEDKKTIAIHVECPHNVGSHGQRCKASHPGQDKVGDGVSCPYSLDLPYAMDIAKF